MGERSTSGPVPPNLRTAPETSLAEAQLVQLSAPEPALHVEPMDAEAAIAIAPDRAVRVEAMVALLVDSLATLDPRSAEYRRRIDDIHRIGDREIVALTEMSGRFFDRPDRAMSGILDGQSPIVRNLIELRRIFEDLDPRRNALGAGRPRRLFGLLPGRDPLRGFFDRYERTQARFAAVLAALAESRARLQSDSAAIAQEERALSTQMEALREYAYLTRVLDESLEARIQDLSGSAPSRARSLRQDVLFPVRQRRQEILTQLAVATQGIAALQIVGQNNQQVVQAIQTVSTTTVTALRTAVMVARAMSDQRLAVHRLKVASDTTSAMIDDTSALLTEHTAGVRERATQGPVDLATLQRAWDAVFATLDQVDAYKTSALATMQATAEEMAGQLERSRLSGEVTGPAADRGEPPASAAEPAEGSMLRIP